MEPVAPLLGQPFGYQTIRTCTALLVCAPVTLNDLPVALADHAVYFAVGLVVTLLAQIILVKSVRELKFIYYNHVETWVNHWLIHASLPR